MKKIFTSILVMSLMFFTNMNGTHALTRDESYEAAKKYYSSMENFEYADHIIACESLGIETDDKAIADSVIDTTAASSIAKTIIALTLHGDNPNDYKGVNYVKKLEECVHDDGIYLQGETNLDANKYVYDVFALYVVQSSKLDQATQLLINTVNPSTNLFGYTWSSHYDDLGITGWVIDALSLIDKTQHKSKIENAINYIYDAEKGYLDSDGGYNGYGYGPDESTQACLLTGLLSYNREGVKTTTYNFNGNNPYDKLIGFQSSDGTFSYSMATAQGCQAIGYYYNGSVYERARKEYLELKADISLDKNEIVLKEGQTYQLIASLNTNEITLPVSWTIDDKNIATVDSKGKVTAIKQGVTTLRAKIDNGKEATCKITVQKKTVQNDTNNDKTNTNKENVNQSVKNPVSTSDNYTVGINIFVMIAFGGLALILRKKYDKNN